jgi:hypothetical protein
MTTDPIRPPDGEPVTLTTKQIYDELEGLRQAGVLEYVLPTVPLGEQWVLGFQGQIIKLAGDDQAAAFLAGASVMGHWAHDHLVPAARTLGEAVAGLPHAEGVKLPRKVGP